MSKYKITTTQLEAQLQVLRALHVDPLLSQRELSNQLGISLGKANYCVQALLLKGWVKTTNFRNSQNKIAYSYLLTPKGIDQKVKLTIAFLMKKQEEFEMLSHEIKQLTEESLENNQ